jgi:hypothetical protein
MGVSLFVDSISGGIARLVYGDGEFTAHAPLCVLPRGTKEGDYIRVSFEPDTEKKKRVTDEIDFLLDELEK